MQVQVSSFEGVFHDGVPWKNATVFPGMSPGREHCDMGTINGLVQGKNYIHLSIGSREELDKFTQFYIIFINQDTSGGFMFFLFLPVNL